MICQNEVQFLDLNIRIDDISDKLKFSLYVKPTNTFQYLHIKSNHPSHIFRNIPKSLFIRIRRICSSYSDYLYFSTQLIKQLESRGYEYKFLSKIRFIIGSIEREKLLPYKPKLDKQENLLRFKLTFDHNYLDLNKDLRMSFERVRTYINLSFANLSFQPIFSLLPNLKLLIAHGISFPIWSECKQLKQNICSRKCNLCCLFLKYSFIKHYNFILPIYNIGNCNSVDSVYIIKCLKCEFYYIGQTKNVRHRMQSHKSIIINYSKHSDMKKGSSADGYNIAIHFNMENHIFERDFRFLIFRSDIKLLNERLNIESDLINIFKLNDINLINEYIPNNKYIRKLCFS
jgi:hypothetical protein